MTLYAESEDLAQTLSDWIRFQCPECHQTVSDRSEVKAHVLAVHAHHLCDVCLFHKPVFTRELKTFPSKSALHRHQTRGEDVSFRGHPRCDFCSTSFYGPDELFVHCRAKHETCHLCTFNSSERADDRRTSPEYRPRYFRDYKQLEDHFREEHFLCPRSDCLEQKFVVFRTEIDLKAHEVRVLILNDVERSSLGVNRRS